MDPLSDVLSLMQPRNYMSAGFDVGGDWSIRFPDQQAAIKTGAVVSGWLLVGGRRRRAGAACGRRQLRVAERPAVSARP